MAELVTFLTLLLIGLNAPSCPLIGREAGDSLQVTRPRPTLSVYSEHYHSPLPRPAPHYPHYPHYQDSLRFSHILHSFRLHILHRFHVLLQTQASLNLPPTLILDLRESSWNLIQAPG